MKKNATQMPTDIDRETRRHILKAAEELFLAKGFKGVSMKEIADVVKVTPAALYYHFPDGKEDLFMHMIHGVFEEWVMGIKQATVDAQGSREHLQMLTTYMLTLPLNNLWLLTRDARVQIKDLDRRRALIEQLRATFGRHLATIFQNAIDANEIRTDIPVSMLANMYIGMIMSLIQNRVFSIKGFEDMDTHRQASLLVAVLFEGIKVPQDEA